MWIEGAVPLDYIKMGFHRTLEEARMGYKIYGHVTDCPMRVFYISKTHLADLIPSVSTCKRGSRKILMHELVLGLRTAKNLVQGETFPSGYRRTVPDYDFVVNPKGYARRVRISAWRLKVRRTSILVMG